MLALASIILLSVFLLAIFWIFIIKERPKKIKERSGEYIITENNDPDAVYQPTVTLINEIRLNSSNRVGAEETNDQPETTFLIEQTVDETK